MSVHGFIFVYSKNMQYSRIWGINYFLLHPHCTILISFPPLISTNVFLDDTKIQFINLAAYLFAQQILCNNIYIPGKYML